MKNNTVTDGFKTYEKTLRFGNRDAKMIHKNTKGYKRNGKHKKSLLSYVD